MSGKDEPVSMGAVEVVRRSEKALLVKSGEHGMLWIPFGQCHEDSEIFEGVPDGDVGELVVTQWLAEERGWV